MRKIRTRISRMLMFITEKMSTLLLRGRGAAWDRRKYWKNEKIRMSTTATAMMMRSLFLLFSCSVIKFDFMPLGCKAPG